MQLESTYLIKFEALDGFQAEKVADPSQAYHAESNLPKQPFWIRDSQKLLLWSSIFPSE
jgi:hypothetical protein